MNLNIWILFWIITLILLNRQVNNSLFEQGTNNGNIFKHFQKEYTKETKDSDILSFQEGLKTMINDLIKETEFRSLKKENEIFSPKKIVKKNSKVFPQTDLKNFLKKKSVKFIDQNPERISTTDESDATDSDITKLQQDYIGFKDEIEYLNTESKYSVCFNNLQVYLKNIRNIIYDIKIQDKTVFLNYSMAKKDIDQNSQSYLFVMAAFRVLTATFNLLLTLQNLDIQDIFDQEHVTGRLKQIYTVKRLYEFLFIIFGSFKQDPQKEYAYFIKNNNNNIVKLKKQFNEFSNINSLQEFLKKNKINNDQQTNQTLVEHQVSLVDMFDDVFMGILNKWQNSGMISEDYFSFNNKLISSCKLFNLECYLMKSTIMKFWSPSQDYYKFYQLDQAHQLSNWYEFIYKSLLYNFQSRTTFKEFLTRIQDTIYTFFNFGVPIGQFLFFLSLEKETFIELQNYQDQGSIYLYSIYYEILYQNLVSLKDKFQFLKVQAFIMQSLLVFQKKSILKKSNYQIVLNKDNKTNKNEQLAFIIDKLVIQSIEYQAIEELFLKNKKENLQSEIIAEKQKVKQNKDIQVENKEEIYVFDQIKISYNEEYRVSILELQSFYQTISYYYGNSCLHGFQSKQDRYLIKQEIKLKRNHFNILYQEYLKQNGVTLDIDYKSLFDNKESFKVVIFNNQFDNQLLQKREEVFSSIINDKQSIFWDKESSLNISEILQIKAKNSQNKVGPLKNNKSQQGQEYFQLEKNSSIFSQNSQNDKQTGPKYTLSEELPPEDLLSLSIIESNNPFKWNSQFSNQHRNSSQQSQNTFFQFIETNNLLIPYLNIQKLQI